MFAFCRGMLGAGYGVGGMGWIGGIVMLIGLVLAGVIVYLLIKNGRGTAYNKSSNAEALLKERLAKGEIDLNTYENLLSKVKS